MQPIEYIINSNPSLFNLTFKDYVNGRIVYSDPTEIAIKRATVDLELFQKRQEAIYKKNSISCGDWVISKDGTESRITVFSPDHLIQIGGNFGGSYHIFKSGTCSYSGGCGEIIDINSLVDTGEYKDGSCWIFSQDSTGAHRSVYNILKFKVWKEI